MIIAFFAHLQDCLKRFRTRRQLTRLSQQQLDDIGVNKEQQAQEMNKAGALQFLKELTGFLRVQRRS